MHGACMEHELDERLWCVCVGRTGTFMSKCSLSCTRLSADTQGSGRKCCWYYSVLKCKNTLYTQTRVLLLTSRYRERAAKFKHGWQSLNTIFDVITQLYIDTELTQWNMCMHLTFNHRLLLPLVWIKSSLSTCQRKIYHHEADLRVFCTRKWKQGQSNKSKVLKSVKIIKVYGQPLLSVIQVSAGDYMSHSGQLIS